MKYLITVILLWTTSYASDVCLTKDGVQGRCKGYADCPFFQTLVTITPIITLPDLVQKYGGCGSWNEDTYLSCPEVSDGKTCSVACSPSAVSSQDTEWKCNDGWILFENSCYFFSNEQANWFQGRHHCLSMGSDYVKVTTNSEWNFLYNQRGNHWIGLNDREEEGTYKWVSDNTTMTDLNWFWWHDDNPDNTPQENGEGEDCMQWVYHKDKKLWNDAYCYKSYPYICEMAPTVA